MTSYRTDQVAEQVRGEIMSIIRRDLKDPRIGFVSITAVRMSPDLRQARVRVSVLGDPDQKQASLQGLISAKGLIRHELGRRLENLKYSPDLRFELDPSIEYSVHIHEIQPKAPISWGSPRRTSDSHRAKRDRQPLRPDQRAPRRKPGDPDLRSQGRRRRHPRLQPRLRGGFAHGGQARVGAHPTSAPGHVLVPAWIR